MLGIITLALIPGFFILGFISTSLNTYFGISYLISFSVITLFLGFLTSKLMENRGSKFLKYGGFSSVALAIFSGYLSYQNQLLQQLESTQSIQGGSLNPNIFFFLVIISFNLPLIYKEIFKSSIDYEYFVIYILPIVIYFIIPIILRSVL